MVSHKKDSIYQVEHGSGTHNPKERRVFEMYLFIPKFFISTLHTACYMFCCYCFPENLVLCLDLFLLQHLIFFFLLITFQHDSLC